MVKSQRSRAERILDALFDKATEIIVEKIRSLEVAKTELASVHGQIVVDVDADDVENAPALPDPPAKCPKCGRSFAGLRGVEVHLAKMHKEASS